MADTRPWGFRDYVRPHGIHTIYLVKSIRGRPIKVGVAEDPERRLANLQNANFEELCFHRFWWLPGQAIGLRNESSFIRSTDAGVRHGAPGDDLAVVAMPDCPVETGASSGGKSFGRARH